MAFGAMKVLFSAIIICAGTCVAQDSATVVLGGTGAPPHLQTVTDGIADALSASGVKVKVAPGGAESRSALLDQMKTWGNNLLLYVTLVEVPSPRARGKILAESFVDGKKVWEENSKGPLRGGDIDREVRSMVKSFNRKLEKRVGGPGLPKAPSS